MDWIDLRSDVATLPTEEMIDSMRNAIVGDDVFEEDYTTNVLVKKAANIVGKEASLFIPSGTFGNQLALLTHTERGDEVIIPESNHILLYEVGAASVIASIQLRQIHDHLGKVNIEELKMLYRKEDIHLPRTGLICIENAHSSGSVVPIKNMKDVYNFAKLVGIPVHLDGARLFNAAIALNVDVKEVTKYCDSVMFSLCKGLASPIGAILAGEKSFIEKARKNKKLMGGGMRQVGYIAAPGLISLDKMVFKLKEDHENAKYLANRLEEIGIFKILKDRLDINLVFFEVSNESFDENKFVEFLKKHRIKINPTLNSEFRFVTYYSITREKIDYVIDVIKKYVSKECYVKA